MFCDVYLPGALGQLYDYSYNPIISAVNVLDGMMMELHEISVKLGNTSRNYLHPLQCNKAHLLGPKCVHYLLHAEFALHVLRQVHLALPQVHTLFGGTDVEVVKGDESDGLEKQLRRLSQTKLTN